jgi:hypothetical protein
MIFVDSHVHIHNCFDLHTFFESALANFKVEAAGCGQEKSFTSILFLTESGSINRFQQLTEYADTGHLISSNGSKKFTFTRTGENSSLALTCDGIQKLFIIAGRQIVTQERMEVLALATDQQFQDGYPIEQVINIVIDEGAMPVIPYGFGKWTGKRGMLLQRLIEKRENSGLFLGDNGGRLKYFPRPSHFKQAEEKGIRILPGSDPLPFPSECRRAGSFGFSLEGSISPEHPAKDLTGILSDPGAVFHPYGHLEDFYRFIINQSSMQLIKRNRNEKKQ